MNLKIITKNYQHIKDKIIIVNYVSFVLIHKFIYNLNNYFYNIKLLMECSICYDLINNNDKLILKCNHSFHNNCIEKWFAKSHHCPLCRDSKFNRSLKDFEIHYYENQTKIINQMKNQ